MSVTCVPAGVVWGLRSVTDCGSRVGEVELEPLAAFAACEAGFPVSASTRMPDVDCCWADPENGQRTSAPAKATKIDSLCWQRRITLSSSSFKPTLVASPVDTWSRQIDRGARGL